MRFEARCVSSESGRVVVFEENGKRCVFYNRGYEIRKIKFDGCVILQGKSSCDYGAWIDNQNRCYFIELKGKKIRRACEQIIETIGYVHRNHSEEVREKEIAALIVTSANNVPNLKQSVEYLKLKKMVKEIKIKNIELKIDI